MVREVNSTWNTDRHNFKWNINELLRLEREYDLLELNVNEIGKLHQRTTTAIAMKLHSENIISSFEEARGYTKPSSDSDNRNISFLINDTQDSESFSEYNPSDIGSDSESDFESDFESESESDYGSKYYKSYAKKHITQNAFYSDSDSETENDFIKKEIALKTKTIYDSEPDTPAEPIENNVIHRVDKLETSVSNMEGIFTKLYNYMTTNSSPLTMGYHM